MGSRTEALGQLPHGSHSSGVAILSILLLHKTNVTRAVNRDLTNEGGDLQVCYFINKYGTLLKRMVFISPRALQVFQRYTTLYYGKFVQRLTYYGITIMHNIRVRCS